MRKAFAVFFLSLLFFSLIFTSVQAQWQECSSSDCSKGERIQSCCPLPPPDGGLVPCGTTCCPCTLCDFFVMLDGIIDFLLIKIVPPLAALMIAIGGGMYIVSQGNPEMLGRAKKLFTSVVIGLLIIYSAYVIIGMFLWGIGLNTWTHDIYHNWWEQGFFEIDCETTTTPSGPPPGSSPSPSPSACATNCAKCSEAECPGSSADCVWAGNKCVSACSQDCNRCDFGGCLTEGPDCAWVSSSMTCKPSNCSSDCVECFNKPDCENVGTDCEWTSSECILTECTINCSKCSSKPDCENVGTNCEWISSVCVDSPCLFDCTDCSNKWDCENMGPGCEWKIIGGYEVCF